MMKTSLIAMTNFCALALPAIAEVRLHPVITLQTAQDVVNAAVEKAAAEGLPGVVAVTDPAGDLLAFARMDDAAVTVAPGKARTAALFARPSGDLEAAINGPRAAAATAGGFVMMKGGLPLIVDGQVVGAIGVSADTPDHDLAIAEAGAAALAD